MCLLINYNAYVTPSLLLPLSLSDTHTHTHGDSASADDDYIPYREPLRFAPNQRRVCVIVTPLDDAGVEEDETFVVSLSHDSDLDRRIHLNPNRATVIIVDDDC